MSADLAYLDGTLAGLCACGCGSPVDGSPSAWWASEWCQQRGTPVLTGAVVPIAERQKMAAEVTVEMFGVFVEALRPLFAAMAERWRDFNAYFERHLADQLKAGHRTRLGMFRYKARRVGTP